MTPWAKVESVPVVVPVLPLPLVVPLLLPVLSRLVVVPLPLKALFNKSESVVSVVLPSDCVLASAAFTINAPPTVVDSVVFSESVASVDSVFSVDSVVFSDSVVSADSVFSVACVDFSVEVCSVAVDVDVVA